MKRSYAKNCVTCGRRLWITYMPNNEYIPFDYGTDRKHDCSEAGLTVKPFGRAKALVQAPVSLTANQIFVNHFYHSQGNVQSFVDRLGSSIIDVACGVFEETVIARTPFTFRCNDDVHWFQIDGGSQPALIVDAQNSVATFKGVQFVSTAIEGTIIVLSGGVRLEGCSVVAKSIGIDIQASERISNIVDCQISGTGGSAVGIRVGKNGKVKLQSVAFADGLQQDLIIHATAKVDRETLPADTAVWQSDGTQLDTADGKTDILLLLEEFKRKSADFERNLGTHEFDGLNEEAKLAKIMEHAIASSAALNRLRAWVKARDT